MSWWIVADDLTGAADAGAPFAARGYSSCIWLHGSEPAEACDVPVFETSSRSTGPGEAYARVRAVAQAQNRAGNRVFKKLDSTLHGNLLAEIRAIKDVLPVEAVIVAPSHPRMGRTLSGGVLYVHGESTGRNLKVMLGDTPWLNVCDCQTEQDLDWIVDEWFDKPVAFAGAGALAQRIAARLPQRTPHGRPAPREGKVAVILGSTSRVTRNQAALLESREDVRIMDAADTASLHRSELAGMLIAGGDTARYVAAIIEATGIRLLGEEIPGVPWGTWIGGLFEDLPIATKAGGFGAMEALADAVRLLKGEWKK